MVFNGKNIKFYYTSLEPEMAQLNSLQSIGGYPSTSLIQLETNLLSSIGLYDTSIEINVSGNLSEWADIEYLNINREIMRVSPIVSNNVTVVSRAVNNLLNIHIAEDLAVGTKADSLFNNNLNNEFKQYRCIAIKNISEENASSSRIYIYQDPSNSDVSIRIAVETPGNQLIESVSTSWTDTTIVDEDLIGLYSDDYFQNVYLKIKSGPNIGRGRVVESFVSSTGTLSFENPLPVNFVYDVGANQIYSSNVQYELSPTPAQRLRTGTNSPSIGPVENNTITDFYEATESSPITLGTFAPESIFYIWIERSIKKGSSLSLADNIIMDVSFAT